MKNKAQHINLHNFVSSLRNMFCFSIFIVFPFLSSFSLISCSTTNGYTEYERTQAAFLDKLGGDISSSQYWKTAVTLKVNVKTNSAVKIWAMSDMVNGTVYDFKEVETSSTVTMTVPQGKVTTIYLVAKWESNHLSQTVTLTGKSEETVEINTITASSAKQSIKAMTAPKKADSSDTDRSSLYGNSVYGNASYIEFTQDQLTDWAQMMDNININGADAKEVLHMNCDYEVKSNGPFQIVFVNGYEADITSHILGYYYHSANTYDDIKYVDLTETHKYDYIDGIAKVQYKISYDDTEWGIMANQWADANFDLNDYPESQTYPNPARRGDNAYNSQLIYNRYADKINALRGVAFNINVPEDMHLGFYLRCENDTAPSQWQRLNELGVKPYTSDQESYKGMCFSAQMLNPEGTHRSFIAPYNNMMFIGMEDRIAGGDFDCNDVIFGITSKLDVYRPEVITPDIDYEVPEGDKMPWTLGYEDVARDADFDFNDAVIKLTPDFENEKCCITVEAAGSDCRMYLHYDGPDGDQNLGEIHEILNGKSSSKINTTSSVAATPFVDIDCVSWPKTYNMTDDAKRFYIEIQRGTCEDCTDIISLADTPGVMPQAVLVAGEWNWPMEGVHICSSYNKFINWAKDNSKTTYWNWYESAKSGTTVDY